MRVACLAASRVPSRTANSIQVMKACQALAELGHDVHLWLPGPAPAAVPDLEAHYGLRRAVPVTWLLAAPGLRRHDVHLRAVLAARAWRADLVYAWPAPAAAWAAWGRMPTLLELHDRPHGRLGPRWLAAFLRAPGARRLMPTTRALLDWVERARGAPLPPGFAVVSPNGVDLERYADLPGPPAARARLGWPEQPTVSYTGHLYAGRGAALMLELARRLPGVAFVWAGGEPAAVEAWRARAAQQGVENLRLLGFVPNADLPLVHAASEALLMPYERRIEVSSGGDTAAFANPMKVYEYLAAGRAILSSDLPVLREVLDPTCALLLEPDDVTAWEAALRALLPDHARCQALGAAARQRAAAHTWLARARRGLAGLEAGGGG